jgi:hypothetical protein
MPSATVNAVNDVLWYDASAQEKTITITNNDSKRTIYPFLRDANSLTPLGTQYAGTATFDAYDPLYNEFRGYIGYQTKDGQFLGLQPQGILHHLRRIARGAGLALDGPRLEQTQFLAVPAVSGFILPKGGVKLRPNLHVRAYRQVDPEEIRGLLVYGGAVLLRQVG